MLTTLKRLLALTDATPMPSGAVIEPGAQYEAAPSDAWWMWLSGMSAASGASSGAPACTSEADRSRGAGPR